MPTQYVQFLSDQIRVVSPTKIVLAAPQLELDGDVIINGNLTSDSGTGITLNTPTLTVNANTATNGTLTNNGKNVGGAHQHSASGGTGVGGPPV